MTPEEAIKILEKKKEYSERIIDNFLSHSRGEIKDANETIEMCDMAISALKEIRKYREIGTVEECREAVEKQKPKKPEIYTDTVQTMNGSFQRDVFECPVCGDYVCNVEDEIPRYCQSCGQKLEESEGE